MYNDLPAYTSSVELFGQTILPHLIYVLPPSEIFI